ncbi:NAD(+) synthase [Tunicatimonas pelagia]|uniref:NAD(+) synthase n=1 Tax=Tunicatimonas pelagia TaxID=931531 RepID=UPI002665BA3A|nr:NAD(+) synthase [Tunicatimonas pelagia]WKN43702.1 NAD(+) synthase [Tunicatimonas pelagia]
MKLTVAGAALNQTPIDWEGNVSRILEAIEIAREQQVDILCLPELCVTGYGCEDLFLSDWVYEKALRILPRIVSACQNITVAVSLPILYRGKRYDTACLIHDQTILGFTVKQFLANDGVHYEPRWFTPWPAYQQEQIEINGQLYDFGDVTYDVLGIRIAFEICEDAWRENLRPGWIHRTRNVDLILNPSASHFAFGKTRLRERLVIGGSEDFNCTYLFVNLLGNEAGRMVYDGEILIAQQGKLLKKNNRLSFQDINLVCCKINFANKSKSEMAAVTDEYDKEIEFTKAESLALFDYLRKSRSRGFVLSLSGGADSSSCAVLVSEMVRRGVRELGLASFLNKLGMASTLPELEALDAQQALRQLTRKLLTTAYQGTVNSSENTLKAAQILADSVGATFHEWKIDDEVGGYTQKIEEALRRELTWEQDDIALQNVQARARNPAIWMLANIHNALLLTTSNRSEGDVGYTTMDGDTSGSIAPIAGVDKHFLIQWLKWAEEHLDYPGLHPVNRLNPTAELRPLEQSQTDESDLMPYAILVEIERLAIRDRHGPLAVYQIMQEEGIVEDQLLKAYITKFFQLWSRNQWKRERIAPSFHMDDFNVDPRSWCRFPILSGGFQEELAELKNL